MALRLICNLRAGDAPQLPDAINGIGGLRNAQSRFGRAYYPAVLGTTFADFSFGFADGEGYAALVECDASQPGALTRFGMAVVVWMRAGLALDVARPLVRDIFGEIERLGRIHGLASALIETTTAGDPDGWLAGRLIKSGARVTSEIRAAADLSVGGAELLADMRKGHRQQVRWGEKNIETETVDASRPDHALFNCYRDLHAEVAGRVTRSVESWDIAYRALCDGEGDLILSRVDGVLMGGTLVTDAGDTAYYASGAYRRDHFDKPLSHYPLYLAMIRAAARGRSYFDIGLIHETGGHMDDKERAIANFKSGFTSRTTHSLIWTMPLDTNAD